MRSLQVFYPDSVTGVLIMGFPNHHPASIDRTQVLLQDIVLYLRTRPGSDGFNPSRGSILGDPASLSKAIGDPNQLKVLVTNAVTQCQTFIINQQQLQQSAGITLLPDETLVSLEVSDVFQDTVDPTTIHVEILVNTLGNQQFIVTT